jgi:hypothetical protein
MLVAGSQAGALVVADILREVEIPVAKEIDLPSDYIIGAALSPDEEWAACWSIDHRVVVWHARSGDIRYRWNGKEQNADAGDRLNDLHFSRSGDWLAITRGEYEKCRTLIVDLTCERIVFDTEGILGYVDEPCREQFVCRFSPDGGAAAILTHHELWIVNLSKSEIEFRVDVPGDFFTGVGDISMEWSETVVVRVESIVFGVAYYRLEPRTMSFKKADAARPQANGRIGENAYPVERTGGRSVSLTKDADLHGEPPIMTRIVQIRDGERRWRYAMPAAVTFVGLAPKSGYVIAGDEAGNFTTLWPREGAAESAASGGAGGLR